MKFASNSTAFPSPFALKQEIPLQASEALFIEQSRQTIINILNQTDSRLLVLVGPCSIHDLSSSFEYGKKLEKLAQEVKDKIFIVMRAFVEKPRTSLGWRGFFHDPYLDGSYAMEEGARQTRQLFKSLTELHLPLGAEILDLSAAPFYTDFLSWGCIGARTSASPSHRQFASSLSFPIGFKNSVDGNIDIALHGVIAAAVPHTILHSNAHNELTATRTEGNPYGHIVLRGSERQPNYFAKDIDHVLQQSRKIGTQESIMIDCSHGNSARQYHRQIDVLESVLRQRLAGTNQIVAVMLESFLKEGSQKMGYRIEPGISITDPCLSWDATEALIMQAYQALSASASVLATH